MRLSAPPSDAPTTPPKPALGAPVATSCSLSASRGLRYVPLSNMMRTGAFLLYGKPAADPHLITRVKYVAAGLSVTRPRRSARVTIADDQMVKAREGSSSGLNEEPPTPRIHSENAPPCAVPTTPRSTNQTYEGETPPANSTYSCTPSDAENRNHPHNSTLPLYCSTIRTRPSSSHDTRRGRFQSASSALRRRTSTSR